MKKIITTILIAVLCISILPQQAFSAEIVSVQEDIGVLQDGTGTIYKSGRNVAIRFKFLAGNYLKMFYGSKMELYYSGQIIADEEVRVQFSSSNEDVIKIVSGESKIIERKKQLCNGFLSLQALHAGTAEITASIADETYTLKVYVVPDKIKITDIRQTGYNDISLEWEKSPGCSGYIIEKRYTSTLDWEVVTTLYGEDQTSTTIDTELYKLYIYRITGFVEDGERRFIGENGYYEKEFVAEKIKAEIESVQLSEKKNMLIKWRSMEGATGYKLYRSTVENGKYQCIYQADGSTTSYKQQINQCTTYYYKVTAIYPEGETDYSKSIGQFIPKTSGKKKTVTSMPGIVNADNMYHYQSGGRLYLVCVSEEGRIDVYEVAASLKVKKRIKSFQLKYDRWGGFYAGIDGRFYIAVGYFNPKESKKKTVIKVIQYNSKWEKMKTASIKGGASNKFTGIYEPFDAGDCRMDMQGNILFLATARTMFEHSDGINHQSNISFQINTDTMKEDLEDAESAPYVSHSFQQFVKFKDNTLYTLDHGDGYPRGLLLNTITNYCAIPYTRTWIDEDEVYSEDETKHDGFKKVIFLFTGGIGDNATGCMVGGMEVGEKNILVCGSSQPHKNKIAGISGFNDDWKYNVFLILCDRETGKTKFKWLTKYNPKKSSVDVGMVHMVKISDSRFAILYITRQNWKKYQLHYLVVSDTGEEIYSKIYTGIKPGAASYLARNALLDTAPGDGILDYSSQPVLYKGNIIWTIPLYTNKVINGKGVNKTRIYSIPAVY